MLKWKNILIILAKSLENSFRKMMKTNKINADLSVFEAIAVSDLRGMAKGSLRTGKQLL